MAKQKKKIVVSQAASNIADKKSFGAEPTFPANHSELTQMQLIKAFNWYSYMMEPKDAIAFFKAFFETRFPEIKKALDASDCQYILTSYGWAARMIDNGIKVPKELETRIYNHAETIISRYSIRRDTVSSPSKSSDASDAIIADVEELLDSGEEFSVYEYLSKNNVPKSAVAVLKEFYTPIVTELSSVRGTKDGQLKEAYRHLSAKALQTLGIRYQSILDDCDKFVENKKIVRKPRAKKKVSLDKKVASVQYCSRFDPLQIVSKPPTAIIGAKEAWLYNTKYKTLTRLISDSGLDIKGTTIINFDAKLSSKKTTGRKSQEIVNSVLTAGKVALRKLMDDLSGVQAEPNGRISKDVVILRVV